MRDEPLCDTKDPLRLIPVVTIEEHDVLATSLAHANISGFAEAFIFLVLNDLKKPFITRDSALHHLPGSVVRRIVNDDYFVVLDIRINAASKSLLDEVFIIPSHYDNG